MIVSALTCGRLLQSVKAMREEHKNEAAAERRSPKKLICCFSLLAPNAHPSGLKHIVFHKPHHYKLTTSPKEATALPDRKRRGGVHAFRQSEKEEA